MSPRGFERDLKKQLEEQGSLHQEIVTKLEKGDVGLRFGKPWILASSISE